MYEILNPYFDLPPISNQVNGKKLNETAKYFITLIDQAIIKNDERW